MEHLIYIMSASHGTCCYIFMRISEVAKCLRLQLYVRYFITISQFKQLVIYSFRVSPRPPPSTAHEKFWMRIWHVADTLRAQEIFPWIDPVHICL